MRSDTQQSLGAFIKTQYIFAAEYNVQMSHTSLIILFSSISSNTFNLFTGTRVHASTYP